MLYIYIYIYIYICIYVGIYVYIYMELCMEELVIAVSLPLHWKELDEMRAEAERNEQAGMARLLGAASSEFPKIRGLNVDSHVL